ncbi:MAG: hypothetical protein K8R88_01650, partial [Armatimonadetes bacterium]|nr:hypothetical protein [Armatimonadota bacterium]
MKHITVLFASALAVAGFAQTKSLINTSGMSFRLGGVYPLEKATRNITGNMIALGADVEIPTSLMKGSASFFSVDWYGKSGSGAKGNFFPVMINQRFGDVEESKTYSFLGVGVVFIDVTNAKTVLGARGGFGTRLSSHTFAELTLLLSGNAGGAKASSVGAF